jgi:hypothetical protein
VKTPSSLHSCFIVEQSPLWLSRWILFALMGASICWAAYEADTQFTIFDLSALKKQCLISLRCAHS